MEQGDTQSGKPPASVAGGTSKPPVFRKDLDPPGRLQVLSAAGVTPVPIQWLWPGWLASGKIAILAGAPGTGKTTLALDLAATYTRGLAWPDGSPGCKPGNVLIWSGEDDPADTLVPRLMAAGADLTRILFLMGTQVGGHVRAFDPAEDMPRLTEALERFKSFGLLIIDPIVSAVRGDSHKAADVRRSLQPIADFARLRRCAVIGITHFSKGSGGGNPLERVIGSQAFGALARVVLVTAKSDRQDGSRILARAKSNIGSDDGGLSYFLEPALVEDDTIETTCVRWSERLYGSAQDLLDLVEAPPRGPSATDEAADWLRQFLMAGPRKSGDIKAAAEAAGHTWRLVQRAKQNLGVSDYRKGFGADTVMWWQLARA